jgi:hypothetical protein
MRYLILSQVTCGQNFTISLIILRKLGGDVILVADKKLHFLPPTRMKGESLSQRNSTTTAGTLRPGRREKLSYSLSLFVFIVVLLSGCGVSNNSAQAASQPSADTIENKGSDTIVNMALAWAEAYMAQNPQVRISVTGGGSGTGIASLINGTVDIANA